MIGPLPRWSAVLAATAVSLAAAVASAGAQAPYPPPPVEVHFFAADTSEAGVIGLYFFGAFGSPVNFYENVGGKLVKVGTASSPTDRTDLKDVVTWRCDRRERAFSANAVLPDGRIAIGSYSVRTPSCATRLDLGVPRRIQPGRVGTVRVIDRWGNGAITPQLCITPPRGARFCTDRRLRRAISVVSTRVRFDLPGRWGVEIRFRGFRVRRSVAVGEDVKAADPPPTVLATGDSTMQGIDTFLADEFGDSARVVSDVRPGTGIAKRGGPWAKLAERQVDRFHPATAIVSLGVVDNFPVTGKDGVEHACCDAGWVTEYTRRVRAMMKSYRRKGRARVLWLTLPLPRGGRANFEAVNQSVVQAAKGLDGVAVLRMDQYFTPNGFTEQILYRGRMVDVREEDGIHLNITGSAIAAKLVSAALRKR